MNKARQIVGLDEGGMRLDKWLALKFPRLSRESWKRRIAGKQVTVNGNETVPSRILAAGELVELILPGEKKEAAPQAEAIPISILYEDDWFAVIDKPAGRVVHPAFGHEDGTLVNALLGRFPGGLSDLAGSGRPGIVHRLDKDTSGILLVARDNRTHRLLADLFRTGAIGRYYDAIVRGCPEVARGLIDAPIARGDVNRKRMEIRESGRRARTEFKVLSSRREYSHLRCRLLTGRTHQIRVHLAYIGHPVIGDTLYGGRKRPGDPIHQLLHASEVSFIHPVTQEPFICKSPLPERFSSYLNEEESFRI
ncbi:MAG TPA: RluA family pseudouridine synthase [Bacillota bacterium]|nr:RluA family pseudouridine synthase [Fastidiosipila sp.]HPX92963.1 RluA family pseudouridine synthase [Bacillota bacterium]HQB80777.1 RluA family pseudouridine synthase [Bacillota bacterium]